MSRLVVLQHLEREGPGLFTKIAKERGMSLSIFRLDQGDPLPELEKEDLLLVLGGPMGIRDINDPTCLWMSEELDLIKDALSKQIAIIGVCLGAQLLAHADGGEVEILLEKPSLQPLPEVGWKPIYFNDQGEKESWGSFFESPFNVLHWHGDRILLPSSAELIASSNRCKEQLFKIGSFAYGLQFHVEIEDEMVNRWINDDTEFIKSALGENAELILRKQQKVYGNKTLNNRLCFLRKIFELIRF